MVRMYLEHGGGVERVELQLLLYVAVPLHHDVEVPLARTPGQEDDRARADFLGERVEAEEQRAHARDLCIRATYNMYIQYMCIHTNARSLTGASCMHGFPTGRPLGKTPQTHVHYTLRSRMLERNLYR